jgi:hypothetical protein
MKDRRTERDAHRIRLSALGATPPRAVIGLEAEFNLFVNGRRRRPEKVFGDPSRLVRRRMIPRTGKSFQLPAGGAIYFDTGVIEVATPIVELERGCCYRDAFVVGADPLFATGAGSLGRATQVSLHASGIQHALQFFVSCRAQIKASQFHEACLSAGAHPAGARDFVGNEPAKQRSRCTTAWESDRSHSRFYARSNIDVGNVCVHRGCHGNRAPLGGFSPETIGAARAPSHGAISSTKTFVTTWLASDA